MAVLTQVPDIRVLGFDENDGEMITVIAFLLWQDVPHKVEVKREKCARIAGGVARVMLMDGHAILAKGLLEIIEFFAERGMLRGDESYQ